MASISPQELAARLGSGLLSFPVTHFTGSYAFDEGPFREHVEWLLGFRPAGLFPAAGAGEFFSLTLDEFAVVVSAAVQQARGRVPVIAGCGYGTAMAKQFAQVAESAGSDGLLLLPPYLLQPDPAGLVAHIQAVCASTSLGVVLYNRDNAILTESSLEQLCDSCPNLIGFKDGCGDIELMTRLCKRFGSRLTFICGMPTAEAYARLYLELGFSTYSSAIFNFLPNFAQRFYSAVRRRDHEQIASHLRDFILPYVEIRNRRKGYAVSIVKAGLRVAGRPAGPVRSPLTDLDPLETVELASLMAGRD